MKKTKRFAAWLLSAAMVLTMLPVQSFAAPKAETEPQTAAVVEEETTATDSKVIQLDDDTAFELEPNTVMAEALMENADAVDMDEPEVQVFMEELDDILVKETTVNADGTTAVAASKLSEEDKQMLVYMYSFYLQQKQNNADVLGVQVPFYLTYNDEVDGMGTFGELLVLAGWDIKDVRAGMYSVDDILGLILNFYYGDYFAVNDGKNDGGQNEGGDQLMAALSQNPEAAKTPGGFLRAAMVAARDGALKAVEDAGCTTLAQKYYVLNEYVCGHDVMDMAYIMNKGTAASMNAKSPKYYANTNQDVQKANSGVEVATGISQDQYAIIFGTLYGFYKNMIAQQFRGQFIDPIKQDTRKGVYNDAYWAVLEQTYDEKLADQEATKQADQFLAFCEQIGGIPQVDEQNNPVMGPNGPELMFTWDDLVDQAMDTPMDQFGGATPNQVVAQYADGAACDLASGVFGYWTGGLIGAMTQSKSVCLGYTGALSFYVQCLDADYYTTNGDYKKAVNWKTPKELYYTNGKIDPKKGYTTDHVRVVFNAEVSMFGEVQPNFSSEHYWNAVKIGSSWYYIDACYIDVYNEVMKRSQVPATGAMNHVYYLISDKTYRDMYTGNYSELYDMYEKLSQDTKYEESWFVRNVTQAVANGGYYYYTYNSTDLIGTWQLMKKMKQDGTDNMDMDSMTKMMEAMSNDYKIVRHSVSANDTIKETEEDGTVKYGADTNFETLIDFAYKANEDSDETYAAVYAPGSKTPVKNNTLTQAYADFKDMEKIYPACSISSTVYNNKVYFSVANAIFTYDLSNGNIQCVKQYPSTVYATRDESVKLGGEALKLANSGSYSVTNAPIAGIYLEDDNTLTVSIGTTYGYICGRKTMVDKSSTGYAWKESNYNKDYNSFSGDDDLFGDSSQFGQNDQEPTVENDNDEFMFSAVIADSLSMSSLSNTTYRAVSCDHKYILLREKTYTKDDDIKENGSDKKSTGENYGVVSAWVCTKCGKHIDASYVQEEDQASMMSQLDQYKDQMGDFDLSAMMSTNMNEEIEAIKDSTIYKVADGKWNGNVYTFSKISGSTSDVPDGFDFSQNKSAVTNITLDQPVACVAVPEKVSGDCKTGLTIQYVAEGYTSEGFHFRAVQSNSTTTLEPGQHVFSDTHAEADDPATEADDSVDYAAAWKWNNNGTEATVQKNNLKCIACGQTVKEALASGSTTTKTDDADEDYEEVKLTGYNETIKVTAKDGSAVGTTSCTQSQTTYKYTDGVTEVHATKTTTTAAHDHVYGEPEWAWTDDFKATATFSCEKCDDAQTPEVTVTKVETEVATEDKEGLNTYTAKATFDGKDYEAVKTEVVPKLTHIHVYGEPEWAWTDDYQATATFKCTKGDDEKPVVAAVTKVETEVATEDKEGLNTYTAKVTFEGKDYTAEKTEIVPKVIPAHTHTYGEPEWVWTDDFKATVTFKCVDGDDTQTPEVTVTKVETEVATEDKEGLNTYTAKATFESKDYEAVKTEVVPKLTHNHVYGEPTWAWTEDNQATATFTCTKGDDVQTPEVTVTSDETEEGTTYTAKVTFAGKDYEAVKTVLKGEGGEGAVRATETNSETVVLGIVAPTLKASYSDPTGHNWKAEYKAEDFAQDGAYCVVTLTCSKCNDKELRVYYPETTKTTAGDCTTDATATYHSKNLVPSGKWGKASTTYAEGKTTVVTAKATGHMAAASVMQWNDNKTELKHGEAYNPTATLMVICGNCQQPYETHEIPGFLYQQEAESSYPCKSMKVIYAATSKQDFDPSKDHPEISKVVTFVSEVPHSDIQVTTDPHEDGTYDYVYNCGVCGDETNRVTAGINVTFKNGDATATQFVAAQADSAATLKKNTFKKTGYHFNKWEVLEGSNIGKAVGKTYENGASVAAMAQNADNFTAEHPTRDLVLKCKFAANTFTVTYAKNGGTGTMSDTKVTYATSKKLTANKFKKTGNHFTGWKASRKSGSTTYYYGKNAKGTKGWYKKANIESYVLLKDKADVKKLTSVNNATVKLTAQWAKNTYTMVYVANGGKGSMSSQKVTYAKTTALKNNKFTKAGYKFNGWKVSYKSGSTTYFYGKNKKGTLGWYKKSAVKTYKLIKNKEKASVITKALAKKTAKDGIKVALTAQWKKK